MDGQLFHQPPLTHPPLPPNDCSAHNLACPLIVVKTDPHAAAPPSTDEEAAADTAAAAPAAGAD